LRSAGRQGEIPRWASCEQDSNDSTRPIRDRLRPRCWNRKRQPFHPYFLKSRVFGKLPGGYQGKLLKTPFYEHLLEWATTNAMTSSEIEQLFDRTLLGDYEDEGAWDAVSALRKHGDLEIFDIAARWLKTKEPLKRARLAAILAPLRELGTEADTVQQPKWLFREEAVALVDQQSLRCRTSRRRRECRIQ
jgi:hypothetical protein